MTIPNKTNGSFNGFPTDDPIEKLAFEMSEIDNDNAPIGWASYKHLARWMLAKYDLVEKPRGAGHA